MWSHNDASDPEGIDNDNPKIEDWLITNYSDESINGNLTKQIISASLRIRNANAINFEQAYTNNDYIEYTFTTASDLADLYVSDVGSNLYGSSTSDDTGDSYYTSVLISKDGFTNYGVLSKDLLHEEVLPNATDFFKYNLETEPFVINTNTTYAIRVYFYGVINDDPSRDYLAFDDFGVKVHANRTRNNDSDTIPDHLDLDSDGDKCADTVEAGHTDGDDDWVLGNSPVTVNVNGVVTGQGGYTGNHLRVVTPNQTVSITSQPIGVTVALNGTATFSTAITGTGLALQWQVSIDEGATWSDLNNNAIYAGVNTANLIVNNISVTENGNDYKLIITDTNNLCTPNTISNSVNLIVKPELSINNASATEGTNVVFTITSSHSIDQPISININYANLSTADADYNGPTSITIPANTNTFNVDVMASDDNLIEPAEKFEIILSHTDDLVSIINNQGEGTILDNDGVSGTGLDFDATSVTVNEADGTATFNVILTGNVPSGFTIDFTTADASAIAGSDYDATSGTLPFVGIDGESHAITVAITDDSWIENTESFFVNLSNLSTTLIGINTPQATGNIIDNDMRTITIVNFVEEHTVMCGDTIPEIPTLEFTGGCGDNKIDYNETTEFSATSEDFMIIRNWTVTDACDNTANFEQVIFVMQLEKETVIIDICVEDLTIDLLSYLPEGFDSNGSFVASGSSTVLNNNFFDPIENQVGTHLISYSSTEGSCKYFVDFEINVNADCVPCGVDEIIVSKTVTANNDNINDYFEITGAENCDFTYDVTIFNRWGAKIYERINYMNNWGGSSPTNSIGSSGMLPTGTYYYIIKITNKDIEPRTGYIYLGTK